ncbi:MAG: preprotein translocase subunit SecE [Flavobacteriales bacterium]|nr:preprotein translocase subunit SecE [Crocinitomicaceae bacterium]NBU90965.1 preprotein translocase subunit SecE [Flavobacteriia bacterium]NBW30819.1 preprotein translocase subunit SecE [Flavobacteriales bacterium]NBW59416.1 preprotein translocase subunit SecE [Crocinitomicaceae bacterium]NDA97842.1 preprotein translocase subunit SecE [Flavobacteriia bacterium]
MFKIKSYFQETYHEMVHNVTWPTWQELQNNTILVVVASILISLTIFAMDFLFGISGEEDAMWKGLIGFIYGIF